MIACEACRGEFLLLMSILDNKMIALSAIREKAEATTTSTFMVDALAVVEKQMAGHGHADAATRLRAFRDLVRASNLARADVLCFIRDRSKELVIWARAK